MPTKARLPVKTPLCRAVLVVGRMVSLTAGADGYYYSPYDRQASYGYGGNRAPVYGSYEYRRACSVYTNVGCHEYRNFHDDRGWVNNWRENRRHEAA